MAHTSYDFEKPIVEIQDKLEKLEAKEKKDDKTLRQIEKLMTELYNKRKEIYSNLSAFQRVLLARKPERPHSADYIQALTTDFQEIHGDRGVADDKAVLCGFADFEGTSVVVIGQQKGAETRDNIEFNFGMMHPEGYRKATRAMQLADKFGLPIFTFIDTPGAYPGIQAEERGQFEAIASSICEMFKFGVPIICSIIGEGASGGAIGLGVGNVVLMLENAWYSVISPEGCASILWRDPQYAAKAAEALKLTADHLLELGVIDEIIPEPLGGAHHDPDMTFNNLKQALSRHLSELQQKTPETLAAERFAKFRAMGQWEERPLEVPNTQ